MSSSCHQCGASIADRVEFCRNCGEKQLPVGVAGPRRRLAGSDLESQRLQVEPEPESTAALDALTTAPRTVRREVLRVSPFVFFIVPVIGFYTSAVLASYTLHFGSRADCAASLNSFLWGAIILGYMFVLGFAWMIVGPRVNSLAWKWSAILVYTILLGILTGMGAAELLSDKTTHACVSGTHMRAQGEK
jgi:hypothetical protein